ncbi:MAG: hypothetical protein EBV03_04500 [Proteobacteria bacterium]|nr:hypothetical protein [Pseudomonadota bacterium]
MTTEPAARDALEDVILSLLWEVHHDPLKKLDDIEAQAMKKIQQRRLENPAADVALAETLKQAFANIRRKLKAQIG